MEPKNLVIINEQHTLLPGQIASLDAHFGEGKWERLNAPASGWTADQQREILKGLGEAALVFASPVTLMLRDASQRPAADTLVFHNDKREKKEVPAPDGKTKIIFVLAEDGWQLL